MTSPLVKGVAAGVGAEANGELLLQSVRAPEVLQQSAAAQVTEYGGAEASRCYN
jgi:hypothetical protein